MPAEAGQSHTVPSASQKCVCVGRLVSAGPGFSEASAESRCWQECAERIAKPRKCHRVNGVIRPQPSELPPTQACQTLQEKSPTCVSYFTCLMAEERMPLREACRAGAHWLEPSRALSGHIQCGYRGHLEEHQLEKEGKGSSIRVWGVWLSSPGVK